MATILIQTQMVEEDERMEGSIASFQEGHPLGKKSNYFLFLASSDVFFLFLKIANRQYLPCGLYELQRGGTLLAKIFYFVIHLFIRNLQNYSTKHIYFPYVVAALMTIS